MKPRRIARTVCGPTGKRRYISYWEARQASLQIRRETDQDHGTPYRCEECGGWHLGSSSLTR